MTAVPAKKRTPITLSRTQPCRCDPTMRPKVLVSAAPITKISTISSKLVSAVGFSNGCAELALKKPPPSPLISLIEFLRGDWA